MTFNRTMCKGKGGGAGEAEQGQAHQGDKQTNFQKGVGDVTKKCAL